jgi:hypothetical protein
MPNKKVALENNRRALMLDRKRLLQIVIVALAIAVGFGGGLLYQKHQDDSVNPIMQPLPVICSCPNMSLRGRTAVPYCHC